MLNKVVLTYLLHRAMIVRKQLSDKQLKKILHTSVCTLDDTNIVSKDDFIRSRGIASLLSSEQVPAISFIIKQPLQKYFSLCLSHLLLQESLFTQYLSERAIHRNTILTHSHIKTEIKQR